ncbi:MAG: M28 family peptidase [Caldilineaceae bacterium]|nr:M28 family peptidase [Caldilineaceae bacterium]
MKFLQSIRLYAAEISLIAALVAAISFFGYLGYGLVDPATNNPSFSGEQALLYVARQVEYGPRITGSQSSVAMSDWLIEELGKLGWAVYIQPFRVTDADLSARNIIAVRGEGPTALLATSYDTRIFADQDRNPDRASQPVPGANDGASGTAVLLELARTLNVEESGHEVCLVFFDAGRNAQIPEWDHDLGKRYFVEQIDALPRCGDPQFAIVIDGVGDTDQRIFRPQPGDAALTSALWGVAAELGYDRWIVNRLPETSENTPNPILEAGMRSIEIFDVNYPHRHTTADTLDKVSAQSLHRIGRMLEVWLEAGARY